MKFDFINFVDQYIFKIPKIRLYFLGQNIVYVENNIFSALFFYQQQFPKNRHDTFIISLQISLVIKNWAFRKWRHLLKIFKNWKFFNFCRNLFMSSHFKISLSGDYKSCCFGAFKNIFSFSDWLDKNFPEALKEYFHGIKPFTPLKIDKW